MASGAGEETAAGGAWTLAKRALSWTLMLAALGYIAWMLRDQGPSLVVAAGRFTPGAGALAVAFFVPMFILKALYQARLLQQLGHARAPLLRLSSAYLQSQLVRYLPGKVWGLVYQSRRIRDSHDAGTVVLANLWQMVVTNVLAMGVVMGLFSTRWLGPWGAGLFIAAVTMVEVVHRVPSLRDRPFAWLAARVPSLGLTSPAMTATPDRWRSTGILVAEWIFYFLGFVSLLSAQLAPVDAILLATWYGAASILALAAFVVPAGLAVREAIFVSGGSFVPVVDPALMLVTATALRFLMIVAEILAAASITFLQRISRDA